MSSETVKNRHNQREQLRQVQQEQAQRKRELAAQQREDVRTIKEFYSNEQKQVDADHAAAVSHVNEDVENVSSNNRTYGRNAKMQEQPEIKQQDYVTKDTDDFYKVQNRGSEMSEGSDGYTIEAYSPEYEKDQIHVAVQNNKAVVSGHRKFQNQASEDNKKISTNNYQSFREEFQFGAPVASEAMTQERSGDYIRVFVPKLAGMDFSEPE